MKPLLEFKNVSYGYTNETLALKNINITINKGERIAVLGNNGAGKSTFFLCSNGVLKPSAGNIMLKGKTISSKKSELIDLRKTVGLVFQNPDDQIIASTVESEISFGPLNLLFSKEQVISCVNEAIENMGLKEYRKRPPHYLSGGEKKRVSIADILAMYPEIILFDEPTASLDLQNTTQLQNILKELSSKGITLMVATHDIDFVYRWAERVLIFHKGELLADKNISDAFEDEIILKKAGLQKPTLYTIAELLCKFKGIKTPKNLPKSLEEFPMFLKELKL